MAAPPLPPPPAAPQPIVIQPAAAPPQWKVERDAIEQLVRQTSQIDGSSPPLTRAWLREIDLVAPLVAGFNMQGPQVVLATRTISGPMRVDVERWLVDFTVANNVVRNAVPWVNLRDYISTTYLSANEPETLRAEVETLRQSALEDVPAYCRRARGVVEAAFPQVNRVPEQDRIAVGSFLSGLVNKELARYVLEHDPADLGQAINHALQRSAFEDRSAHLGIKKEEQGKVVEVFDPSIAVQQPLSKLFKQLEQLTTKLAKVEATVKRGAPSGARNQPSAPRQYRPLGPCFYCQKPGHLKRNCYSRRRDMQRGRDGNTPPDRQHSPQAQNSGN